MPGEGLGGVPTAQFLMPEIWLWLDVLQGHSALAAHMTVPASWGRLFCVHAPSLSDTPSHSLFLSSGWCHMHVPAQVQQ